MKRTSLHRKWPRTMSKAHAAGVKSWEIIADNLSKAGWSWGYFSALDRKGRTIWIVDAHTDGKRFIVRADEILTAFVELQRAIHEFAGGFDLVIAAQKRARG